MKTFFFIIIFLFSLNNSAQSCNCATKPYLKETISCSKTYFTNGAEIFWNYDCNSSSLIFQNKNVKRKIFKLENELQDMTGNLGYVGWIEGKKHFIIKNKTASGCCYPLEFYLFNKDNGKKEKNLGTLISDNYDNKFIVTLFDLNTALIYDLTDDKITKINLAEGRIANTLKRSGDLYPEPYFFDVKFIKGIFSMNYKYLDQKNKWKKEQIKLKLHP